MVNGDSSAPLLKSVNVARLDFELLRTANAIGRYPRS